MIHPPIAKAVSVRVVCPCCDGRPHRYSSGPTREQAIEFDECPECDGIGTVEPDHADEIRERGRRFWRED